MKTLVLLIFTIAISFSNKEKTYNDYDSQLTRIAVEFRKNIMSKDKCEKLKNEAYYLKKEIEKAIKNDDIDLYEKNKLKQLLKESEAIEGFISCIGNCGNMFEDIDMIYLANQRINASISNQVKYNYCIDIYQVSLNGYYATIACNNSSNDYSISYKWKATSRSFSGNGNMGLPKKTMRPIYDNRDNPELKNVNVLSVGCEKF